MTLHLHYKITVKGKVQGVWFRASTQAKAHELNLTGFVRNQANGDVYIEAEGIQENLSKLVDWCYVGSPRSEVTEVISEEGEWKDFKTFEIKK